MTLKKAKFEIITKSQQSFPAEIYILQKANDITVCIMENLFLAEFFSCCDYFLKIHARIDVDAVKNIFANTNAVNIFYC